MAYRVNRHVLKELSGAFGTSKDADCVITFCREANPANTDNGQEPGTSRQLQLVDSLTPPSGQDAVALDTIGAPLPAHRLVLRAASDRFATQLERWTDTNVISRPELRIPLGSEDEISAALAALEYAYTGYLKARSIREALLIRHQAEYLGIKDCAADCDALIERLLQAGDVLPEGAVPGSEQEGGATGSRDRGLQQQPPFLEFYGCGALWPNAEAEPGFAALLNRALSMLVAHFCDALKTLNTPSLREQMLALPATALEALLGSEGFGTDTESSVLLLLASWMKANFDSTDEQTRQRLSRTVRLAQLHLPYRNMVLPGLAADFVASPGSAAGWFPLGPVEAAFASSLTTLTKIERRELLDETKNDPWVRGAGRLLELSPRPQCVPPDGLTLTWHLKQEDLEAHLQKLAPGCAPIIVKVCFDQTGGSHAFLCGFEFDLGIELWWGKPAAGLYLGCRLPTAFRVSGSRLDGKRLPTVVSVDVGATVHRWQEGVQRDAVEKWTSGSDAIIVGNCYGSPSKLRLLAQAVAGGGGSDDAVGADGESLLGAWSEYLHDGKITGTLTLMRPPPPPAAGAAPASTAPAAARA